ncbi:MAG TPA: hypothetical protein VM658_12855 [bacterium]|nr:hypothetical protein [bacterium]
MARIKHINCPKCGGTLGLSAVDRVVKCRYCGVLSLVGGNDEAPEYYVRPKVKEVDARRKVQGFLRDPEMPAGMIKEARLHSARLYFIPYYELTGRRLGTMQVTEFKAAGPPRRVTQVSESDYGQFNYYYVKNIPSNIVQEKTVDTRVVMSDVVRLEPAVKLDQWGIEESDIGAIRSDPAGLLQPMDRRDMERHGKIYDPGMKPEQMLNYVNTKVETSGLKDDTEIAEVRVKRVYYPVWRVRYRYQGRLYGVSVDGVTAKIMAARAPQDDRFRVYWLLGTTALVSFIVGRLAHALVGSIAFDQENIGFLIPLMAKGAVVIIPVALVGIGLALAVMGLGWEQYRYPGEIVVTGDKREIEKISKPERTTFDALFDLTMRALNSFMSSSRKRRLFE